MTLPPSLPACYWELCASVRPFTAGITGQGCTWSEAWRQLVEWDASVAGGYKVSFPKGMTETTPVYPHTRTLLQCFYGF